MKKLCSLLSILCLIFSLSACGDNESTTDNDTGSFCTECGEEISSTDKFCGSCGTAVSKSHDIGQNNNENSNNAWSSTEEQNTPVHTHSYSDATCIKPAQCSCGKTNGNALGHNYSNGVCLRCGTKDPNYTKTYSIGEKWVVNGQWEFTVNSVKTHSTCNSSWNNLYGYTSEQVIIIDYTYKNLGYTGPYQDLYLSGSSFHVYDENGETAQLYACTHTNNAQVCIIGTKCTAQEAFVLLSKSSKITLVVSDSTSNGMGQATANFVLNVN